MSQTLGLAQGLGPKRTLQDSHPGFRKGFAIDWATTDMPGQLVSRGGGRVASPSGCASNFKVGSWSEVWLKILLRKLQIALPPARELSFQKQLISHKVRKNVEMVLQKGTPRKGKTALGPLYASTVFSGWCPCSLQGPKWRLAGVKVAPQNWKSAQVCTIEPINAGLGQLKG